ncbi:Undecaprenyl diphosphate synthase [hydrothermal vent metagenome]|uniref:Undecaprenyl diphosphate synthase n=1 Tax=hydrothermal vent metagenome TaxID=652676 RepID=A0A3B1CTK7_9ZZZZ
MTAIDCISRIDKAHLPRHIAIIMDGNGRWAKKKKLPRVAGHYEGVKVVDKIVTFSREIGIKALTLYSFSSENWRRPKDEVGVLMEILQKYVVKELGKMMKEDIKLQVIGRLNDLPGFARESVMNTMMKTKNNKGMTLTLALSYGSRDEITGAVRKIGGDLLEGLIGLEEITEEKLSSYLNTKDLPDPDLLIRTSGELRVSNFLLWQIAYTELFFSNKLWPDFGIEDMAEAILSFQQRERRYGKTTDQLTEGKR